MLVVQEYDKVASFHKTYSAQPHVSDVLENLSSCANQLAQTQVKDVKVVVLESLLLEAVSQVRQAPTTRRPRVPSECRRLSSPATS